MENLIYIGPSMPAKGLRRYMVFKGGYPPHIEGLFRESAALRGLVVPCSELAKAKADILKKGTLLNLYARSVRKEN